MIVARKRRKRLVKPRLRGVVHELGFYAAVAVGVVMVVTADPGKARMAGVIFASCVALCFGASASTTDRPGAPGRAPGLRGSITPASTC